MSGAARYDALFARLATRREGAFVPFAVLGDPDRAASVALIRALVEAGADALELGVPFSDPVADGPAIQAANLRALAAGFRVDDGWSIVAEIRREHAAIPIGLLVYANLVLHGGAERFYARAAAAGVDSVLIADAPLLESARFEPVAAAHGVAPVLIAPPSAGDERLAAIAARSRGYVYVTSRPGVTGADRELNADAGAVLASLRRLGAPPALLGFGIAAPEHVRRALALGARGAISGSAIAARVADHRDDSAARLAAVAAFVREMKAATLPV